ncbi:uncharacterized protein G2W53_017614 [Senna tora]|uniref:Uncharacterized protein n=1 Tax=Senna tora TaxID=362788 RepID=A0A834TUG2_9FABA|nr:uncharacterized protein G2W53_017614 [Senna tora]
MEVARDSPMHLTQNCSDMYHSSAIVPIEKATPAPSLETMFAKAMENIQAQFTTLSASLIAKQNDMNAHVTKLANSISKIQANLNSMPSNTVVNSKALNAISKRSNKNTLGTDKKW